MRVLLINPPYSPFTPPESAVPPLGLARIAAASRAVADVRVLDMGCLEALGRDSWTALIDLLDEYRPDIAGIGPLVTSNVQKGEEVARVLKASEHPPMIVIGGPDPTFTYQERLEVCKDIEVVFLGEAEFSFPAFIQVWQQPEEWFSLKGIAFRHDGATQVTQRTLLTPREFAALPPPAWDLFPLQCYAEVATRAGFEPYLPVESSRGCPFECIFCATTQLFAHRVRHRPGRVVVDEIQDNARRYGYRRFVFNDDNATVSKYHILKIAKGIINRKLEYLQVACSTTVEAGIFADKDALHLLKQAGFRELFMGCESPHPDIIAMVGKTVHPERWPEYISHAVSMCREVGIASRTNWILGLPGDAREKFLATIDFIRDLKPDSALLSLLQPYPGTRLASLMESDPASIGVYKLTSNPSAMIASKFDPVVYTRWMSREEMIELAYKFIQLLSPYCESNVSGSPYYIFELWRDKQRGR